MHVEYVRTDDTIGDSFLLVKESSKDLIIPEEEKGLPAPGMLLNILVIAFASIFKKENENLSESY